ncbi:MAG: PAS domain S-box protein [Bacteroidota bacterium]
MEPINDPEKLLQDYRELQLRVTRFSFVEQQLINTRDRLDHELELYKRLNKFSSLALRDNNEEAYYRLILESVVDVFEVENSILFVEFDKSYPHIPIFLTEGFSISSDEIKLLQSELKEASKILGFNKSHILEESSLRGYPIMRRFSDALFTAFHDAELGFTVYIAGLISIKNAPLYQKLQARHETIFSVFSQQVQALMSNRIKSDKIKEQIKKISASEIELKKLSLIATKTKNGVVITDSQGKIEWVNDSFVSMSGYTLEEVRGKKPKDFLQREDVDNETQQTLSRALANKENVEVTVTNYHKNGTKYYNQLVITPVFDEQGNHINFISLQKDITSEIKYQKDLLRINSRFELITTKSMIGIWEFDPNNHRLIWNDVLIEQYGTSKNEFGDNLFDFWQRSIHEDDRERIVGEVNSFMHAQKELMEQEFRIIRQNDQSIRTLKCLVVGERNSQGNLLRLIGTSVDVTESKEAERKLRASEEKYRGIIDNMNLGLVEVNMNGRVLFSNKKFHDLTLLKDPSPLVTTENIIEELNSKIEKGIIQSYRRIEESVFEIDYLKNSDELIHLLVSNAPVLNQDNKITGFISIYLDITSVKNLQVNLEKALKERDASLNHVNTLKMFYENIINQTPSEVAVIYPDLNIGLVNNRLIENEKYFNNSEGKNLKNLIDENPDEKDRINSLINYVNDAIKINQLVQMEDERLDEFNDMQYIFRSILPHCNEIGEVEYVVISGIDITDLKKIQQDVIHKNEELKKINAELDNFVYSVSHDLRSPLLSIKGILSLVINSQDVNEKTVDYLKMAESTAVRLDGSIQEILEYSRNARMDIKPEEVDLKILVQSIFEDLKFSAELTMEFLIDIEEPSIIVSDKARLNALLKNIIGNSVKYRRTSIENSFVKFKMRHRRNEFHIEVEDNGMGIAEKSISKIFDMFYRGTSSSMGTGLGLYITKEILNKLGGRISVESKVNEGTKMTVILPRLNIDKDEKILIS